MRAKIETNSLRREFIVHGNPTIRSILAVVKEAEETYGAKVWTWRVTFAEKQKGPKVKDYSIPTGLPYSPPEANNE